MPGWVKWTISLLIGFAIVAIGWKFSGNPWLAWILPTFFVINCLVLIIVVLLQSGKAADLAGAFGGAGSQTAFGPRGAATVLSQATTWCAVMFMVCALALVVRVDKAVGAGSSVIYDSTKATSKPATPAATPAPATTPAQQTPAQQTPAPANSQPATQTPAPQKK